MANEVEFRDFSFEVKAALNDISIAWLYDTGNEIAAHAKRNCKLDGEKGTQLRGSYEPRVDETKGEVQIGTPFEWGYWEEYGTGEYADTSKNGGKEGRKDWWVYIEGEESDPNGPESHHYYDEMEAMMMAAWIQQVHGKPARVSNGRRPNYTLEKAFDANKNPSIAELERRLKEGLGE